ncbi:hypothetical protein [Pyrodictium delaneyi]|nr:hypothetical protein [Pyrodictium delaneyi]
MGAKRAVLLALVAAGAIFISYLAFNYTDTHQLISFLSTLVASIGVKVELNMRDTSNPGRAPGRLGFSASYSPGSPGPRPGLGRVHVEAPGEGVPRTVELRSS